MTIYTHTGLSAPTNTSATTLRKWASLLDAMILACGWVQTADTGQSDPATINSPANNTAAGYRVYSLDDALAGVAPVLMKVEWGQGGTNTPSIWLTIGRTSDGAGNLSGLLLARTQSNTVSGPSPTEVPSYASGDGSSLNVTMWPTLTATGAFSLRIERSRTLAGEPTAEALAITLASVAGVTARTIAYAGTPGSVGDATASAQTTALPGSINGANVTVTNPGTLSQDGDVAPVFPVVHAAPGVTPWVSANMAVLAGGDAGASSLVTVNTHGTPRTFRSYPLVGGQQGCDVTQAGSTSRVAITAQVWAD